MERYFYNTSIYIGNLALSGEFLWSWNEVVLCFPVNLVANKNKTKTSDGVSILIRKISRWTIIWEENFVLIRKGDGVLWLFQIKKKRKNIIHWIHYLIDAVCIWWRDFWGQEQSVLCLAGMPAQYLWWIQDELSTLENIKKFQLLLYKDSYISQSVSTDSDGNGAVYGHYD